MSETLHFRDSELSSKSPLAERNSARRPTKCSGPPRLLAFCQQFFDLLDRNRATDALAIGKNQGWRTGDVVLFGKAHVALQGIGIAFILAGMLSLAFLGFSGML